MMATFTFNEIQTGRKFKTTANITYQKVSTKEAKPILDASNEAIQNGRVSTLFYNSKFQLEIVTN